MTGILLINKPKGYTSHDIIAILRGISKARRLGHTGTLDPNATGLLCVCFGKATRLIEYMEEVPKSYLCTARLGLRSDTEDIWGELKESDSFEFPSAEKLVRHLERFKGELSQTPPMYSAIRVNGRRLYSYARSGESVNPRPRIVTIYDIELLAYYPCQNEIIFSVKCGRGTYIRSICRELGESLGCGAVMSGLTRTSTSGFDISESINFESLRKIGNPAELEKLLLPLDRAIDKLPKINVDESVAKKILNGSKIEAEGENQKNIAVMNAGSLIAIMDRQDNILKPIKVFKQ
jgi:tRNA pseudouridine55 synthase